METELRELLRYVASESVGDSHTHVSLYGPRARWTIGPETQSNFWVGYCELVDRKMNGREALLQDELNNPEGNGLGPVDPANTKPGILTCIDPEPFSDICLAERPLEVMPQIAKFTFRFQVDPNMDNDDWEPYDEEFLQQLCHTYQSVISEYFRLLAENQMELVVVVMESQTHWFEEDRENNQRYMLMEVRLQFPYAKVDAGMQSRVVRPRVIQLLRNNNVMSKMQRQPIGDWEQIISSSTNNEPVVMYGSAEAPGRPKLEVTHIWAGISEDMIKHNIQP